MSLDIPALRERFRQDQARYEAIGQQVRADLAEALQSKGIAADVTCRGKTEASFLRKAIVKSSEHPDELFDPFAAIKDRAGVRIVVPHLEAATAAQDLTCEVFLPQSKEDVRDRYAPDQLGYLGVHIEVELRPEACGAHEQHLLGVICEVQIHTKAQSAWAVVSHPMLYKPVGGSVSPKISRRVHRAVALVDLFDDEIDWARREVMGEPDYQPAAMLTVLEPEFLTISPNDFNSELSLRTLSFLQSVYTEDELEQFAQLMAQFMRVARPTLKGIFDAYVSVTDVDPLLFQPEVIAIYERLSVKPELLRDAWIQGPLDVTLLDSLQAVLGR